MDSDGFGKNLVPGYHLVRLTKVIELRTGDYLAILSNGNGECAEWVPEEIDPEMDSSFRYWRLAGAFDYPSAEFWNTPRADRPDHVFDTHYSLGKMKTSRKQIAIRTSEWEDKDGNMRPNLVAAWSLERKEGQLRDELTENGLDYRDLANMGSIPWEPSQAEESEPEEEEKPQDQEVPF